MYQNHIENIQSQSKKKISSACLTEHSISETSRAEHGNKTKVSAPLEAKDENPAGRLEHLKNKHECQWATATSQANKPQYKQKTSALLSHLRSSSHNTKHKQMELQVNTAE